MPQTTLFTSPMARKKPVPTKYDPNSYRVISQDAEVSLENRTKLLTTFSDAGYYNVIGQDVKVRPSSEHRHNRPNPRNVNFLRQDVHLLNEPICNVGTRSTHDVQQQWWPHRSPNVPADAPRYTYDSTMRDDYRTQEGNFGMRPTRHGCNTEKQLVQGVVPVNFLRKTDGKQRFWKEGISYEHQYNCRQDPQYPIRSKRQGAFVWDEFPSDQVDRMLHELGYISDKLQQTEPYGNVCNTGHSSRRTNGGSSQMMPKKLQTIPVKQPKQEIMANGPFLEEPASHFESLNDQKHTISINNRQDCDAVLPTVAV